MENLVFVNYLLNSEKVNCRRMVVLCVVVEVVILTITRGLQRIRSTDRGRNNQKAEAEKERENIDLDRLQKVLLPLRL